MTRRQLVGVGVQLPLQGQDLLPHEPPYVPDDHLLFIGEMEVQGGVPFSVQRSRSEVLWRLPVRGRSPPAKRASNGSVIPAISNNPPSKASAVNSLL